MRFNLKPTVLQRDNKGTFAPATHANGPRPSYFSEIKSSCAKAAEALDKQSHVEKTLKITPVPDKIEFSDFDCNAKVYSRNLSVKNFSKKLKRISIELPKSEHFSLFFNENIGEVELAPGMQFDVTIVFKTPKDASNETAILIQEHLNIISGNNTIKVPIIATPILPSLEIPNKLDFGTLFYRKQEADPKWENSSTRFLEISNKGSADAKFDVIYDKSLPLRINPTSLSLQADEVCQLKVQLFPDHIGSFKYEVFVHTSNQPLTNPNSLMRDNKKDLSLRNNHSIMIQGIVKEHQIIIRNKVNNTHLDPSQLKFGKVYYGESVGIPIKLENICSTPVKWDISHSGLGSAIVPGGSKEKSLQESYLKAAFSVTPSEGSILPYESVMVLLSFIPSVPQSNSSFKSGISPPLSQIYDVPMQLKVSTDKEDVNPVELTLTAEAIPLLVTISKPELTFPTTSLGSSNVESFILKNEGEKLGLVYSFEKIAHIYISKSSGSLGPLESTEIQVIYKPNQIGSLQQPLKCQISSPSVDYYNLGSFPLKKSHYIKEIIVTLHADCIIEQKPSAVTNFLQEEVNDEWKNKIAHHHIYTDYMRASHKAHIQTHFSRWFGNTGIAPDYKKYSVKTNFKHLDPETGLTEPEYRKKRNSNIISSSASTDSNINWKIPSLIKKLFEPISHKSKKQYIDSSNLITDALSESELSNIFASVSMIDLGDLTVHSSIAFPLNFLNATSSNKNIHVAISINEPTPDIKLGSSSIIIPSMTVAGLEIRINSHIEQRIERKLTYVINGRYKYNVPIFVNIKPIELRLDNEFLLIKCEDITVIDQNDLKHASSDTDLFSISDNSKELMLGEKKFTLHNEGDYAAGFSWSKFANAQTSSGSFSITPVSGKIDAKSSIECKVVYIPGTPTFYEEDLELKIIDLFNSNNPIVVNEIKLRCRGEVPEVHCKLLNSSKQGPLDLGVIAIGYQSSTSNESFSSSTVVYNEFAPHKFNLEKHTKSKQSKSIQKGSKAVKIKNLSSNKSIFKSNAETHFNEITCLPHSGVLIGNSQLEINLSVLPINVGLFEDIIHVQVIGGEKIFKVPVKFEGKLSVVEMDIGSSNFATGTIIGSIGFQKFKLHNLSTVSARIMIDLRLLPYFEIHNSSEGQINDIADSSSNNEYLTSVTHPLKSKLGLAHLLSTNLRSNKKKPSASSFSSINNVVTDFYDSPVFIKEINSEDPLFYLDMSESKKNALLDSQQQLGKIYIFDINPADSVELNLLFKPKEIESFSFNLPVRVLGNPTLLSLPVKVESIASPVNLSVDFIDFKSKVIIAPKDREGINCKTSSGGIKNITIENTTSTTQKWKFDLKKRDKVFDIVPPEGELQPYQKLGLTVTFNPEKAAIFNAEIPLLVESANNKISYLNVRGTGVEPSLACFPPEIFLPVAPVGVETSSLISIINYGCDRTEVQFKFDAEVLEKYGAVELIFPEGRILKDDGEKLPVIVKFISKIDRLLDTKNGPVSFLIKVEFTDNSQYLFYLPIHGTIEASFLTLCPLIWGSRKQKNYTVVTDMAKNNILIQKNCGFQHGYTKNGKKVSNFTKVHSFYGLEIEEDDSSLEQYYSGLGSSMMRWLEYHFNFKWDSREFPKEIINSGGQEIFNLMQSLSGKKVSGSVSISALSAPVEDKIKYLQKQYLELLTQLQMAGGLICNIKPELLLSFEEFKIVSKIKLEPMNGNSNDYVHEEDILYNKDLHKRFILLSKEAWCMVLLQSIKIYVCQSANMRSLRSLPSIDKELLSNELLETPKGNRYSSNDNVLLKWVNYHILLNGGTPAVTNFDENFSDFAPLFYLLKSHLPELAMDGFIISEDITAAQRVTNKNVIERALNGTFSSCPGVNSFPYAAFLSNPVENAYEMYLLVLFLYHTLPQFVTLHSVDFNGTLHEKITRFLEITNSGAKSLTYFGKLNISTGFQVTLENSTDVTISKESSSNNKCQNFQFSVPAKGTFRLPITFSSRFSSSVCEKVLLKTKKMALNSSSILVFQLNGIVTSCPPTKSIKLEASLFCGPPAVTNLEVVNPFPEIGRFKINFIKKQSESSKKSSENLAEEEHYNPPSIFAEYEEIELAPGEVKTVAIKLIPFALKTYEYIILFIDENVGEFSYQLECKTLLPATSDTLHWTCKSQNIIEKVLKVPSANTLREKAIHSALMCMNQASNSNLSGKTKKLDSKIKEKIREKEDFMLPKKTLKYKVEYSSQYFKGPSEILLHPFVAVKDQYVSTFSEKSGTDLQVVFSPNLTGKYTCKVVLTCQEATDVRVFMIQGNSISQGSVAEFDFTTPIRRVLKQEIPISNNSRDEWTIKATLQGTGFDGPLSMIVPANTIIGYPVAFKPTVVTNYECVLTLSNLHTSQKHIYHLKGRGEDPLPEEQITLEGETRKTMEHLFVVSNTSDSTCTYNVTTNIPHSSGESTIEVKPQEKLPYSLIINPIISGKSQCQIYFTNIKDQSYLWYNVNLHISPPPSEETIPISVNVRSLATIEINLLNPLTTKEAVYNVIVQGDGLEGDATATVQPSSSTKYIATYAPMKSKTSEGFIKFINADIGEFWYDLKLNAIANPPTVLPEMSCSLGKCASQILKIENPTNKTVKFEIINTNSMDFHVVDASNVRDTFNNSRESALNLIILEPLQQKDLCLIFWPPSIANTISTTVTFLNKDIESIIYITNGYGKKPDDMPETIVYCGFEEITSSIVNFINPLNEPINIKVSLEYRPKTGMTEWATTPDLTSSKAANKSFSLINSKKFKGSYLVAAREKLDIPFTFSPFSMTQADAFIVVTSKDDKLSWKYPLKGIPEKIIKQSVLTLECRLRETLQKELEFNLENFYDKAHHGHNLSDHDSVISLSIEPLGSSYDTIDEEFIFRLKKANGMGDYGVKVSFTINYSPKQSRDLLCNLILTNKVTGGRWRQAVKLHGLPPKFDDVIIIEGNIGKLSAVAFNISNNTSEQKKFTTYFSKESASEFSISPTKGILYPSPADSDTNKFTIGYKPSTYGKTLSACLIIEAEGTYWSFDVKGVPPHHVLSGRPQKKTGLSKATGKYQVAAKKNFVFINATKRK